MWILDLGAIDHVCHSLVSFHCHRNIKSILIKLPNGSQTTITISRTIFFSQDLYLTDILFVPSFPFNLISISNLISTVHCKLTFTKSLCKIQDLHMKRMIGATEEKHGLYVLNAAIVGTSNS